MEYYSNVFTALTAATNYGIGDPKFMSMSILIQDFAPEQLGMYFGYGVRDMEMYCIYVVRDEIKGPEMQFIW